MTEELERKYTDITLDAIKDNYKHVLAVDRDDINIDLLEQDKPHYTLYNSNSAVVYTYPDVAIIVFSLEDENYEGRPTRDGWGWNVAFTEYSLEECTNSWYDAVCALKGWITETEEEQLRHWMIAGWIRDAER